MSALVAFLAAAIIQSPNYWIRLAGIFVLFVSLMLDDCDGDIARYKNMASDFGKRLDLLLDSAKDVVLLAAVSSLAFNQFKASWIIWAGSLALGGTLLYSYSSDLLYGLNVRKWDQTISFSRSSAKFCIALLQVRYPIMAVFMVLNYMQIYLIFAGVTSLGAVMFDGYSTWKESKSPPRQVSTKDSLPLL
jgi:phosphatidylglycerophosphate synthase